LNALNRVATRAIASALLIGAAGIAHAGRDCEKRDMSPAVIRNAMDLALRTSHDLDQSGANVVVLGRIGQNLSEYGIKYSHVAFAYKVDGNWRVVHKLNECGTANAAIYRQGLGEFFLDDMYRFEAGYVIPTPEVQAKLLPALSQNEKMAQLNTVAYSMVAYPWAQKYQQSNQWAIETLAMTQEPAAVDRVHAQAWLQLRGYEPTNLHISALKRLGADVASANVAFDDHPRRQAIHRSDRNSHGRLGIYLAWPERHGQRRLRSPLISTRSATRRSRRKTSWDKLTTLTRTSLHSSSSGDSRRSSGRNSWVPETTTFSSLR
jgi:hypothetical protein